ncbi:MAG TPA: hypothetical protein VNJ29_00065 [Candidatus Nitrosotenuis sp.]|jgi:hypothetical protein|nr:hypothetical protein [Candidatus Nitrosotenuis sp.]
MRLWLYFFLGITTSLTAAIALDQVGDPMQIFERYVDHRQATVRTELTSAQQKWVQQIDNFIKKGVIIKMTIYQKSKGLVGIRARGSACHSWSFNSYRGNYTCDRQSAINFLNYYLNNDSVVIKGLNILPELSQQ